jgi:hypothetical protein
VAVEVAVGVAVDGVVGVGGGTVGVTGVGDGAGVEVATAAEGWVLGAGAVGVATLAIADAGAVGTGGAANWQAASARSMAASATHVPQRWCHIDISDLSPDQLTGPRARGRFRVASQKRPFGGVSTR